MTRFWFYDTIRRKIKVSDSKKSIRMDLSPLDKQCLILKTSVNLSFTIATKDKMSCLISSTKQHRSTSQIMSRIKGIFPVWPQNALPTLLDRLKPRESIRMGH